MTKKFWNFSEAESGRTLFLNGEISDETWWGDEVTPELFRAELNSGAGDIDLWINSPGGDVFAASQIYNMLKEYPGRVTVKIDSLAASAASVIAMAGDTVYMSPTALLMIHNPMTAAIGDSKEMQKAIDMLDEVKESIINAYELKTGLRRSKISQMMDAETWLNAKKAIELNFADGILYDMTNKIEEPSPMMFSRRSCTASLLDKIKLMSADADTEDEPEPETEPVADTVPEVQTPEAQKPETETVEDKGTPYDVLETRLKLLKLEVIK